ncbi:MAG: VWA domain-containing protein [Deltaproteobacteria bacterium]|nr:VWA domain-containing protein [Deltaproteobacteria bacterium]
MVVRKSMNLVEPTISSCQTFEQSLNSLLSEVREFLRLFSRSTRPIDYKPGDETCYIPKERRILISLRQCRAWKIIPNDSEIIVDKNRALLLFLHEEGHVIQFDSDKDFCRVWLQDLLKIQDPRKREAVKRLINFCLDVHAESIAYQLLPSLYEQFKSFNLDALPTTNLTTANKIEQFFAYILYSSYDLDEQVKFSETIKSLRVKDPSSDGTMPLKEFVKKHLTADLRLSLRKASTEDETEMMRVRNLIQEYIIPIFEDLWEAYGPDFEGKHLECDLGCDSSSTLQGQNHLEQIESFDQHKGQKVGVEFRGTDTHINQKSDSILDEFLASRQESIGWYLMDNLLSQDNLSELQSNELQGLANTGGNKEITALKVPSKGGDNKYASAGVETGDSKKRHEVEDLRKLATKNGNHIERIFRALKRFRGYQRMTVTSEYYSRQGLLSISEVVKKWPTIQRDPNSAKIFTRNTASSLKCRVERPMELYILIDQSESMSKKIKMVKEVVLTILLAVLRFNNFCRSRGLIGVKVDILGYDANVAYHLESNNDNFTLKFIEEVSRFFGTGGGTTNLPAYKFLCERVIRDKSGVVSDDQNGPVRLILEITDGEIWSLNEVEPLVRELSSLGSRICGFVLNDKLLYGNIWGESLYLTLDPKQLLLAFEEFLINNDRTTRFQRHFSV